MGLLMGLLTLPAAPLRGVIAVAEQVRDHAEEVLHDPDTIRAELARVDAMRHDGLLTDDEATAWEDMLVDRLMAGRE